MMKCFRVPAPRRCTRAPMCAQRRYTSSMISGAAFERPNAPYERPSRYGVAAANVADLDDHTARDLTAKAATHLRRMLNQSLKPTGKIDVYYDTRTPLSKLLANAYREAAPEANVTDFFSQHPDDVKLHLSADLQAGDLVVLIQSENFNLNDYRIRLELFNRGLKVVEHVHLSLLPGDHYESYINALGFDSVESGRIGKILKEKLDRCSRVLVESSGGNLLHYEGGMEAALLNLGDYTGMKNVGGTFPVGEVFSEPKDLTAVNGSATIFGFPSLSRVLAVASTPFRVQIEKGLITEVADDAPQEFKELLARIRQGEGDALLREFGVGLNRAMGRHRPVAELTAFERQQGLHFSIGRKHTVYKKPGIKYKKPGQYHIDVFVDVQAIKIDDEVVFKDNEFLV